MSRANRNVLRAKWEVLPGEKEASAVTCADNDPGACLWLLRDRNTWKIHYAHTRAEAEAWYRAHLAAANKQWKATS